MSRALFEHCHTVRLLIFSEFKRATGVFCRFGLRRSSNLSSNIGNQIHNVCPLPSCLAIRYLQCVYRYRIKTEDINYSSFIIIRQGVDK